MKLKFAQRKGLRIKGRFDGFKCESNYWFDNNTKKWTLEPTCTPKGFSSHLDCRSVRAFRRKLKKAPKGVKFVLQCKYYEHWVYGVGNGSE